MKKLIIINSVSGVGKSTTCNYIKDNNLLDNYSIYDIDDLENINDYTSDNYNLFYENAIKKANVYSGNNNIIIGTCININDIKKLSIPNNIETIELILITCSNNELYRRLKSRDVSRNCSSDEYINDQIKYQDYMIKYLNLYNLHIDNTNLNTDVVAKKIVSYINSKK